MYIVAIYNNFEVRNEIFTIDKDNVKEAFQEAIRLYHPNEVGKDYFEEWLNDLPDDSEDIKEYLVNSDYSVSIKKL